MTDDDEVESIHDFFVGAWPADLTTLYWWRSTFWAVGPEGEFPPREALRDSDVREAQKHPLPHRLETVRQPARIVVKLGLVVLGFLGVIAFASQLTWGEKISEWGWAFLITGGIALVAIARLELLEWVSWRRRRHIHENHSFTLVLPLKFFQNDRNLLGVGFQTLPHRGTLTAKPGEISVWVGGWQGEPRRSLTFRPSELLSVKKIDAHYVMHSVPEIELKVRHNGVHTFGLHAQHRWPSGRHAGMEHILDDVAAYLRWVSLDEQAGS